MRAVIFDIDGLLVDTEIYGSKIFRDHLNEIGVHITSEEAEKYFFGVKDKDSFRKIKEEKELDFD